MKYRLLFHISQSTDPYYNLATEKYLTDKVKPNEVIMFLWQNRHTVVIGRNQNALRECRTAKLKEDGGALARRLSGGGAVYHDMGNLNFTFSADAESYDQSKQQCVIVEACKSLGIDAGISGRNDILAAGRKFSGNSFYSHAGKRFHNGTLLINADMDAMTKYLAPSKLKLQAKGVESARARVINLCELVPDLTIGGMNAAMIGAFSSVYGERVEEIGPDRLDEAAIEQNRSFFAGEDWIYGKDPEFTLSLESKFNWGELVIKLNVLGGVCKSAAVYTDAMDFEFASPLSVALTNCPFKAESLCERVKSVKECAPYAPDICQMLTRETER